MPIAYVAGAKCSYFLLCRRFTKAGLEESKVSCLSQAVLYLH